LAAALAAAEEAHRVELPVPIKLIDNVGEADAGGNTRAA
jgi:hypothetical protein